MVDILKKIRGKSLDLRSLRFLLSITKYTCAMLGFSLSASGQSGRGQTLRGKECFGNRAELTGQAFFWSMCMTHGDGGQKMCVCVYLF